jgi:hypothetical protein
MGQNTVSFNTASDNVPAIYDVLAARIRALRSIVPEVRGQGRQNVAEVKIPLTR